MAKAVVFTAGIANDSPLIGCLSQVSGLQISVDKILQSG